jgi:pimeloyl-ACP methyl ester carboxylesterase
LSVAVLLSSRWCLAQHHCPNAGQVEINPLNEETLDSQYQPYPSPSPAVLKRYRFVPPGMWPPTKKFPTVLMVPPNVFQNDMIIDNGEPHENGASYDLMFAGFLVFQVETRLAIGKLPGQSQSDPGTAPEQTDDLKRQILAALADPQCDGNIYLVGGSAGGCLALWCALDPASTVSGWDESARAHIKAVVSLSGPTDFCDWSDDPNIPMRKLTKFEDALDEYVGLDDGIDCTEDTAGLLEHASPHWLVTNGATSNPPAIMLYATIGDHVPYYQADDMNQALITHYGSSVTVDKSTMTYVYGSGYEHAFNYWHSINDDPLSDGECVSEEVITFLQSH